MLPSMSRPANPWDNASCESFMKTLKREEIYANKYEDIADLRAHIAEFVDRYYNRQRCTRPSGTKPRRSSGSVTTIQRLAGSQGEFFKAWGNLSIRRAGRRVRWGTGSTLPPGPPDR
jgi:hypothetical protein